MAATSAADGLPDAAAKEAAVQRIRKEQPIGRAGGVYIPPHKLAEMNKAAAQDKSSKEYQRMTWEALRKSINGLINKVHFGPGSALRCPCRLLRSGRFVNAREGSLRVLVAVRRDVLCVRERVRVRVRACLLVCASGRGQAGGGWGVRNG